MDIIPNYYKILGVHKTIDVESLKKQYKKLLIETGDSRTINLSSEEQQIKHRQQMELIEAYKTLQNPQKKQEYDTNLRIFWATFQANGHHNQMLPLPPYGTELLAKLYETYTTPQIEGQDQTWTISKLQNDTRIPENEATIYTFSRKDGNDEGKLESNLPNKESSREYFRTLQWFVKQLAQGRSISHYDVNDLHRVFRNNDTFLMMNEAVPSPITPEGGKKLLQIIQETLEKINYTEGRVKAENEIPEEILLPPKGRELFAMIMDAHIFDLMPNEQATWVIYKDNENLPEKEILYEQRKTSLGNKNEIRRQITQIYGLTPPQEYIKELDKLGLALFESQQKDPVIIRESIKNLNKLIKNDPALYENKETIASPFMEEFSDELQKDMDGLKVEVIPITMIEGQKPATEGLPNSTFASSPEGSF